MLASRGDSVGATFSLFIFFGSFSWEIQFKQENQVSTKQSAVVYLKCQD